MERILFPFLAGIVGVCLASSDVVILEPSYAKNRETLFKSTMQSWVGNRSVNIKIGVLNVEGRDIVNEFWLEFDPVVNHHVARDRVILPYIVDIASDRENVSLNVHKLGGCSSIFKPSGSYNFTNKSNYIASGIEFCNRFVANYDFVANKTNESLLLSDYMRLWNQPYTSVDAYRMTFEMSASTCYHCQAIDNILEEKVFESISIVRVIDWFDKIDLLIINAQGMDASLVSSLNSMQLSKIAKITLKCQGSTELTASFFSFLYQTNPPYMANSCSEAQAHLEENSFSCRYEINNCGCAEFNLHCQAQNRSRDIHSGVSDSRRTTEASN